jgi:hypothetical protein
MYIYDSIHIEASFIQQNYYERFVVEILNCINDNMKVNDYLECINIPDLNSQYLHEVWLKYQQKKIKENLIIHLTFKTI